jgi:uncharacterized protein (UPF0335 family)
MSASDTALMHSLIERVEKLESQVKELMEARQGRELQPELYGEQPDHTAEREARRGPGRPPGLTRT